MHFLSHKYKKEAILDQYVPTIFSVIRKKYNFSINYIFYEITFSLSFSILISSCQYFFFFSLSHYLMINMNNSLHSIYCPEPVVTQLPV